jgi:hypothetical protein
MDAVAFVFAERFEDVGIGHQRVRDFDRNRLEPLGVLSLPGV